MMGIAKSSKHRTTHLFRFFASSWTAAQASWPSQASSTKTSPAHPNDVNALSRARTCNFRATAESSTTKTQGVRGVSDVCLSSNWSRAFARSRRSACSNMSKPRKPPARNDAPTPSASFSADVTGFVPETAQGPCGSAWAQSSSWASDEVTGPPMVRIDVRGRGASSSDGAWTATTDTPCKPAAAVIAAPMSPLSHNTKRNLGPLLSSIRLRHDDALEKPSTASARAILAPMLRAASRSTSTHFFRRSGFESKTATPTTPPDNRPSDRLNEVTEAHARDSPMRICPNWGEGGADPSEDARGLDGGRGASGSGLRNANVPAVGAGSRGGGGRPPGRPNRGGVQSDVCAWRLEQRPAILENVAPVSLMSRDETSGLSMDTLGMSR